MLALAVPGFYPTNCCLTGAWRKSPSH